MGHICINIDIHTTRRIYSKMSTIYFSTVVVQLLSRVRLSVTPWTASMPAWRTACLSFSISWSFLKLMSIESVMPSNHLNFFHPLLLLPSIFSSLRDFSNESAVYIKWPKYWSFGFSISPSNEYSGLISFRIDWCDLLAVQGTLKSSPTPQFKSISSSVFSLLWGPTLTSAHDYWKDHSFDYVDICQQSWCLCFFNTLSSFVIAFLPRSKCLLISWLQSLSAVILEPKNIKSVTASTFSPSICHEVMGPNAIILVFWMLSFKPTFSLSSLTLSKRLFSFFTSGSISYFFIFLFKVLRFSNILEICMNYLYNYKYFKCDFDCQK